MNIKNQQFALSFEWQTTLVPYSIQPIVRLKETVCNVHNKKEVHAKKTRANNIRDITRCTVAYLR